MSGTSHESVQTVQSFTLAGFDQIMLETPIHQFFQNDPNISGTSHGLVQTAQFFVLIVFDIIMLETSIH